MRAKTIKECPRCERERRNHNETLKKLIYYEKIAGVAQAYRLLYKHLSWGPDGGLSNSEDHLILEQAEKKLDMLLEQRVERPWMKDSPPESHL